MDKIIIDIKATIFLPSSFEYKFTMDFTKIIINTIETMKKINKDNNNPTSYIYQLNIKEQIKIKIEEINKLYFFLNIL